MSKVLPTLVCPECHEPFTPLPRRDGTLLPACRGCIRVFNGRARRGVLPPSLKAAIGAKKQIARQRVEAQLRETFGVISDRDAALFSYGLNVGYDRGYDAAYHATGRRRA